MEAPGSHSQFIKVPERVLWRLPDNLDFESGSLICDLLALVCHATKKITLLPEQKIIIFGAGPVGITLATLLKKYGIKSILLVDPTAYRRQLAKKFNLKTVENKKLAEIKKQFDVVFETSGNSRAFDQGYKLLKRGGKMVLVGVPNKNFNLKAIKLISRELTLFGIFDYSSGDINEGLQLVKNKKIDLRKIITHRFSLAKGEKAHSLLKNKKAGKIILIP
jgi:2-desacetyl-2-hydroxyethyl bacteriochlorophyllide A dehydrogenase